jgi:branched-chain amino acid transport system substrate-binding protein
LSRFIAKSRALSALALFLLTLCAVVFWLNPARTADAPLAIVATIPLTGDAASYGEIQKRGYELALAKANDQPNKPLLRLLYRDTHLNPRDAVSALQQSLLLDKPQVVFSISTAEVMAQAPIANSNKIVLLSPLASGDEISKAGPYVFRVSPSDSFQGNVMGDNVVKLGVRTFGVLYTNSAWGVGLSTTFRNALEQNGGRIVAAEGADPTQVDFRTALEKIRALRPEGIFLILNPGGVVAALRQIKELGVNARLFGADTLSDQSIYKSAAKEAQGVIFSLPATPDSPAFKDFAAEYQRRFNAPADINAAAAYDSVMLVARAAGAGATTGEQIKSYFESQQSYEGASGTIAWDKNHDVISKTYALYRVEGNGYKPFVAEKKE